jgi:hypothetical protein
MAAKNCFWSRVQKYAFFPKRSFFLTFSQYCQNGGLYLDGVFFHFKITLFSKNPLQATRNTKTKFFIALQRIYTKKK